MILKKNKSSNDQTVWYWMRHPSDILVRIKLWYMMRTNRHTIKISVPLNALVIGHKIYKDRDFVDRMKDFKRVGFIPVKKEIFVIREKDKYIVLDGSLRISLLQLTKPGNTKISVILHMKKTNLK